MAAKLWHQGIALILFSAITAVSAADFMQGVEAYTRGDYPAALAEFNTLAEQGHLDAQNNLGVMYNTGKGVKQDNAAAARWYRQAAERGHRDAQSNLAALYVTGKGVPQDYVLAYAWFNQAAQQGDESARQNRDYIAQRMTPAQVQSAQQMALLSSPTSAVPAIPAPAPAPTPLAAPAAPVLPAAPAAPVASAPPTIGGDTYGPVAPGTTLWSVAVALRPNPSISPWQIAHALHRTNPHAFSRGITLKPGAVLRVPAVAEMQQVDAATAKREVEALR